MGKLDVKYFALPRRKGPRGRTPNSAPATCTNPDRSFNVAGVNLPGIYQQAVELHRGGRFAEAEALYRQILAGAPAVVEVLEPLAGLLDDTNRPSEAAAIYQRITTLRPDNPDAWVGLGNCLRQVGKLDGAIDAYRRAVALRPDYAGALNNLANAVWDSGGLDEAISLLRRAASIGSDPAAASNLLFALHFDPSITPKELRAEHDLWNRRFARRLFAPSSFPNPPDPDRRLKIGYVSPDFRSHPVALFMLPLLENHDRERFEITCYSDAYPDGLTRHLSGMASRWRDTRALSDTGLADLVRGERIDVLVDLALHSRGSRLLTFARKPAPVQVTYLGYASTTGLDAMDYRLSDPYLDPPGSDTGIYSEETIRLPASYWCYRPMFDIPEPGPLPALAKGHVTFGCLNNFYKIGPAVLDAWERILSGVADSRLILHAHDGSHREKILARFAAAGIDRGRIEFVGAQPLAGYFQTYRRIDIALDPFPFPGATTTLDALWSGVPVVTLAGASAVSRAGVSILSNVQLGELISHDAAQYTAIATSLATDPGRLAALRASLRQRVASSRLADARSFARDIEDTFREMWRHWCARQQSE
jgi:protein O-GlcNAc transferase